MADYGMTRNGSGYWDETPYKAVMGMPKAGEVWSSTQNKLFLVLKNHGEFCTVLGLNEYNRKNECLPVTVEYTLYTNPGMLSYLFNAGFAEYVKRIPDEEYIAIMDAVAEALAVTLTVKTEADDSAAAEISELQARCAEIAAMAAELDKCKAEMHAAQSAVEEVRAQRDTYAQKLATAENAAPDMYKGLYYELLDRILQRG